MTYPQWERLKKRVESIEYCSDLSLTAIGALIAIVATAIFGIFSLQETNPTWRGVPHFFIYLAIIGSGTIFTLIFIYYHIKIREVTGINKRDIIEEMKLYEARYEDQRGDNLGQDDRAT